MKRSPMAVFAAAAVALLAATALPCLAAGAAQATAEPPNRITGVLVDIGPGTTLKLQTRDDRTLIVHAQRAQEQHLAAVLVIGKSYTAIGTIDATGALDATRVTHAADHQPTWPEDR